MPNVLRPRRRSVLDTPCQPMVGRSRRHRTVAVGGLQLIGGGVIRQLSRARIRISWHRAAAPTRRAPDRRARRRRWGRAVRQAQRRDVLRPRSQLPAHRGSSTECGRRRCSRPRTSIRRRTAADLAAMHATRFQQRQGVHRPVRLEPTVHRQPRGSASTRPTWTTSPAFLRPRRRERAAGAARLRHHASGLRQPAAVLRAVRRLRATRCTSPRRARRSPPSTGATSSPRSASARRRWTRSSPTSWPRNSPSSRTSRRCRGARGR